MRVIGGREIHPINVRVGGFYRAPRPDELRALVEPLRWARETAYDTVRWVAGFEFPDFEQDYEFVALRRDDEYAILDGRLVSNRGLDIPIAAFNDHIEEEHVPHSNALHARIRGRGAYLVGPLARFNLNFDRFRRWHRRPPARWASCPNAAILSRASSPGPSRFCTPATRRSA
nr:hypothetical protein [Rhodothermus marinus]